MLTIPSVHWYILGVGAIGSLWVDRLMQAGCKVTVIAREANALTLIRHKGITVEQKADQSCRVHYPSSLCADSFSRMSIAASLDVGKLPQTKTTAPAKGSHTSVENNGSSELKPHRIQNLLITTKTNATLAAFEPIISLLDPQATILLLQNGLGNGDRLKCRFPSATWFVATTTDGAYRRTRVHTVHAGKGETKVGYLLDDSFESHLTRAKKADLIDVLGRLKITWQWVDDVNSVLWLKLIINSVINPLTVVLDCNNGELEHNAQARSQLQRLCSEFAGLSAIQRRGWTCDFLEQSVLSVIQKTATNYSSSVQDVRGGRVTEIDSFNGYLAAVADTENIAMPVNHRLYLQIKAIEENLS